MTDNLLLQHILFKSKYSNLKEFARACFDYLRQKHSNYNWSSAQSLYVRLRDNLIGDCQTIFDTKSHETRNIFLTQAIAHLLCMHQYEVIRLATTKVDKQQQINNLQVQIDRLQRLDFSKFDQKLQIDLLIQMIKHLNQIIYLK
tara:strand:+ start:265 stop:696 length:432 start_codon:yes stop_codon:yes gene_type:complete